MLVQSLQEAVDFFARHIVVDQGFGEPFGNIAGQLEVAKTQRNRQGLGSVNAQSHPGAAPANLIAGAVDEDALWGKSGADGVPDEADIGFVVLAEHVEGAHHAGLAGDRNFKAAHLKIESLMLQGFGDADTIRLNFNAGHMCFGADGMDA